MTRLEFRNLMRALRCAGLGLGLACSTVAAWAGAGGQSADQEQATTRAAQEGSWLRVIADEVNARSRPDGNSIPVARVERDAVLRAVSSDQYGWYRVLPPEGAFSYVSAEHVDRRGPTEGIVSVRSGTLRVRVGSLVRELDPLQSEVQILLERGTPVHIVGEQGVWLKIVPPPGVYAYVWGEHVEQISAEVAARLRSAKVTSTRPAGAATKPAEPVQRAAAATQPTTGPDLSGPWGQRLVLIETAIEAEARKPLPEQQWVEPIARLRPIAAQREEPMVARLAAAWIAQLDERVVEQGAVRDAEEVLQRTVRDQAQHQRETQRIERVRRAATRPAFAARGELLRSYAIGAKEGTRWYQLRDPLTHRMEAYVEISAGSKLDPREFVGRYVGVRGPRRTEPGLGADVVRAEEIVALQREGPATRPARQEP